jgi:hypothetical protein
MSLMTFTVIPQPSAAPGPRRNDATGRHLDELPVLVGVPLTVSQLHVAEFPSLDAIAPCLEIPDFESPLLVGSGKACRRASADAAHVDVSTPERLLMLGRTMVPRMMPVEADPGGDSLRTPVTTCAPVPTVAGATKSATETIAQDAAEARGCAVIG